MESIRDILTLSALYASLYFEIFVLIAYLGYKKKIDSRNSISVAPSIDLPGVTVIVPCYNEEKTVVRTLDSLFALDYPKDKLTIMAVNDGSTDGTSSILAEYAKAHPELTIIHKENGGKHTALNLGIKMAKTRFVGCLDADSYVKSDALLRIMDKFKKEDVAAVVPSLHVYSPRTFIQKMQKVEYLIGIFLRSILAELNALYVTPGPFSIFKKEVFETIGYYKKAHNTEDMEMALRMQTNKLRIGSAHDAVVFTSSPKTVAKLYKQRVRWTSGFFHNVSDYRYMLFNARYGHVGGFILPMMLLSFAGVLLVVFSFFFDTASYLHRFYVSYQALGANVWDVSWPSLNWFFMGTSALKFGGLAAMALVLFTIFLGSRMSSGNRAKAIDVVSYLCLYSFIAPFWVMKSLYNFILKRNLAWR